MDSTDARTFASSSERASSVFPRFKWVMAIFLVPSFDSEEWEQILLIGRQPPRIS
jgi:hypothetical protein